MYHIRIELFTREIADVSIHQNMFHRCIHLPSDRSCHKTIMSPGSDHERKYQLRYSSMAVITAVVNCAVRDVRHQNLNQYVDIPAPRRPDEYVYTLII